ncbi:hypothetical protein NEOLEDRAFT_1151422 [Neolentinus lepideus HHB14362 ss-1]|uniref:Uncharacterized protein n=1 Tax=Neolentinus lepideus HHB14362 ss-1 TaxID=1314782 RepID=A0A165NZI4_9AGAM|nr:hypothetical protein NEOLEDRAFT_1151422 [Neolentinus lepideus HHB14362 ss-1]
MSFAPDIHRGHSHAFNVTHLSADVLADYRDYIFPRSIRDAFDSSTFSLATPTLWVKMELVDLYLNRKNWVKSNCTLEDATHAQLKRYKIFVEFSLYKTWVNIEHFNAFLASLPLTLHSQPPIAALPQLHHDTATPSDATLASGVPYHAAKQEPLEVTGLWLDMKIKKQRLNAYQDLSHSGSDSMQAGRSQCPIEILDSDEEAEILLAPSPSPPPPSSDISCYSTPSSIRVMPASCDSSYGQLLIKDEAESSEFAIPKDDKPAPAGILVHTKTGETRVTSHLSVKHVIYLEHIPAIFTVPRESTAYVIDFTAIPITWEGRGGDENTYSGLIRKENLDSWNGSSGHASGDCYVYGLLGEMKELWWAELDANERKNREPSTQMARFFQRVMESRCQEPCKGKPVMVQLAEPPSKYCKYHFIGCSAWSHYDTYSHHYVQIEKNIDEDELRELLQSEGKNYHKGITLQDKCPLLLHPCHSRTSLMVKFRQGPLITLSKVVVVLEKPHNHPVHPSDKLTFQQKALVKAMIKNADQGGTVSAMKLRLATTTTERLGGATWSTVLPAYSSAKRLRALVKCEKTKEYPHRMGWEGVLHKMEHQQSLPESKCGETNEWEVAGMVDRYNKCATLASLYCTRATREAFYLVWKEFFNTINKVTNKPFHLQTIHKTGSCKALIVDAEPAQVQALGDILLEMNDLNISGITSTDALFIAQYVIKTCSTHWDRNIDNLPKDIPIEVIKRLKGFPGLRNKAKVQAWQEWCFTSEYKAVRDWYAQKISHPWYLPSVNQFLSPMPKENWLSTPDHTNLVETAHAAWNAETGINSSLLDAIKIQRQESLILSPRAYSQDQVLAAEFAAFEDHNHWNGPAEQESKRKKNTQKSHYQAEYMRLKDELAASSQKKHDSLIHKGEIQDRLSVLQIELQSCCSDERIILQQERQELEAEQELGLSTRKTWVERKKEIEKQMSDLKDGPLKGARRQADHPSIQGHLDSSDDSDTSTAAATSKPIPSPHSTVLSMVSEEHCLDTEVASEATRMPAENDRNSLDPSYLPDGRAESQETQMHPFLDFSLMSMEEFLYADLDETQLMALPYDWLFGVIGGN